MSEDLQVVEATPQSLVPAKTVTLTRAAVMNELPVYTDKTTTLVVAVETHADAKSLLAEIRGKRKLAEVHHADQKRPINAFRDRALTLEKDDVGAWKKLEDGLAARLLAFETEAERQRKEEEARVRREAEALAKQQQDAAAEALRQAARETDDSKTKRAIQKQAREIAAAPVYVAPVTVAPVIAASSTRTTYAADIVDPEALVLAVAATLLVKKFPQTSHANVEALARFCAVTAGSTPVPVAALELDKLVENHPWLNGQAVQLRAELRVPGVVAVERKRL